MDLTEKRMALAADVTAHAHRGERRGGRGRLIWRGLPQEEGIA